MPLLIAIMFFIILTFEAEFNLVSSWRKSNATGGFLESAPSAVSPHFSTPSDWQGNLRQHFSTSLRLVTGRGTLDSASSAVSQYFSRTF